MKIASFVRDGCYDCGLVDEAGRIHLLDGLPLLDGVAPEQRLAALLALAPDARRAVAAELDWDALPVSQPAVLAPAVPQSPLYILGHGNSPTIWQRQMGPAARWQMPRITMFRVRPFTSFSGHGDTVEVPQGAYISHGTEFGVVLGRAAYRVPESEAADYIAGAVVLNDIYVGGGTLMDETGVAALHHLRGSLDTLKKAADGNGVIGPWVTTIEELEERHVARLGTGRATQMRQASHALSCLYDLLACTSIDGQVGDRAHTSATLKGAEYLIAYFSRFMTLPAGTVLGLGAAGWDGQVVPLDAAVGARCELEVAIEDIGACRTTVVRVGEHEGCTSPYFARRGRLGLPTDEQQPDRPSRKIWICRGNHREASDLDGIPPESRYNPLLYPSLVLAAADQPLVLAPHMTHIRCECHLAGVIGRAVYNPTPDEAIEAMSHLAVALSVRDMSLWDGLHEETDYEARSAFFLGGCADGFLRLSELVPLPADEAERRRWMTDGGSLRRRKMEIAVPGVNVVSSNTSVYRGWFAGLVEMVGRQSTLLPGDVLSLGPAPHPLFLQPRPRLLDRTLRASVDGLPAVEVAVVDERDPTQDNPFHLDPPW